jgi:hypothetical protein
MPSNGTTFIRTMARKPDGTFLLIAEHSIDPNNHSGFFNSVSNSILNQGLTYPMFDGIILINCDSSLKPYKVAFLYWQPSSSFQFIKAPVYNDSSQRLELSFIYHEVKEKDTSSTYVRLQYDSTITSAKTILKNLTGNKTNFYEGRQDNVVSTYFDSNTKMLHLILVQPFE